MRRASGLRSMKMAERHIMRPIEDFWRDRLDPADAGDRPFALAAARSRDKGMRDDDPSHPVRNEASRRRNLRTEHILGRGDRL